MMDVGKDATSRLQIFLKCILIVGSVDGGRMQEGWTEEG